MSYAGVQLASYSLWDPTRDTVLPFIPSIPRQTLGLPSPLVVIQSSDSEDSLSQWGEHRSLAVGTSTESQRIRRMCEVKDWVWPFVRAAKIDFLPRGYTSSDLQGDGWPFKEGFTKRVVDEGQLGKAGHCKRTGDRLVCDKPN